MRHVSSYSGYPTEGIRVARAIFATYIKQHIFKLIAAKNPAYSQIIDELTLLYEDVFGDLVQHEQTLNDRISLTKNIKAIKKEYSKLVDNFEEVIGFKFHRNSSIYLEIFPHGVTPYKTASLPETGIKMKLAETLATKYKETIGEEYSVGFNQAKESFDKEVKAQGLANGEIKNIIPNYKAKRHLIDKQLLKNVCVILMQNLDDPNVLETFFDEQLIFPKNKKKEETQPVVISVLPNSHIAANIVINAKSSYLLTNTGSISLYFYTAPNAAAPVPANLTELLRDEEKEISGAKLGAPDNKYIIFVNHDLTNSGEAEIITL